MTATQETTRVTPAFAVAKLTPVLVVDAIEPCLALWVDRLGFTKTVEVPHEDALGFVILVRDGIELMYQTRASVEADLGLPVPRSEPTTGLFIEVSDIDAVQQALAGVELALPRRRTFYGMEEVGVREPGGAMVIFAMRSEV